MRKLAKKTISLLCIMSMLFSMIVTAQSPETTLEVISKTIEQGTGTETVEVPIQISNNRGILGMTIRVSYDEELTLTNAVKGVALSSLTFTKAGNYAVNPFNLVWDGQDSADTSNGVVAVLTFTVPKGTAKDYPISITTDGVFDENVNTFTPSTVNGKISVVGNEIITDTAFNCELYFDNTFEEQTALAILAFYDEHGKLVQLKFKDINVKPGKIDLNFDIEPKPYSTYKLMIWKDWGSMKPLVNVR